MLAKSAVPVLLLTLALSVLLVSGCPKPAEPVAPPAPDAQAPPAAPADPAAAFEWTETPTVDAIPAGPVKGTINGEPFEAKMVRVKQGDKSPSIEIIDMAPDKPSGMVTGDTAAELDFPLPPGKPGEYVKDVKSEKNFDKEHAYYYYPQGGDKGPMSVNPDWGAALVITEWTTEKDPADENVLGKVKGKVLIVFDDEKKSWVGGDFEAPYYK
ncbi:MAG: hypothetical protein ACYC63_18500 [Armatimonadota bacterium]